MPMNDGKYVAPTWVNGGPPALDASEMQAISDAIEAASAVLADGITRIECGGYLGTGAYGAGSPNSLTFGFEPKLVMVRQSGLYAQYFLDAVNGVVNARNDYDGSSSRAALVWSDNTLSWYSENGAERQLNGNNLPYFYIAIG